MNTLRYYLCLFRKTNEFNTCFLQIMVIESIILCIELGYDKVFFFTVGEGSSLIGERHGCPTNPMDPVRPGVRVIFIKFTSDNTINFPGFNLDCQCRMPGNKWSRLWQYLEYQFRMYLYCQSRIIVLSV